MKEVLFRAIDWDIGKTVLFQTIASAQEWCGQIAKDGDITVDARETSEYHLCGLANPVATNGATDS